MGKMSRQKGARGEREVAKILSTVFPEARRRCSGAESQCDQGRDLDGTPGYCVQVNLSARPPIERKWTEAKSGAKKNETPIAITKRSSRKSSGEWLVTLGVGDFIRMLGNTSEEE